MFREERECSGLSPQISEGLRGETSTSDASECDEKVMEVFDLIRDIRDPEKDQTLEELNVVAECMIKVEKIPCDEYIVKINFTPTVPHCSLATLIGLCLRVKLKETLPWKHKLDISITKGSHATENEINKQINDKERVAAAMENPNLMKIVEDCLAEPE